MNELFFRECRAAGLVFKTSNDWFKWMTDNSYDIKKPVAEHEGFKYNIMDVCINPHVIGYSVEGADNWGWKVMTANTQFGWIWGYSIQKGKHWYDSPAGYPSRYDTLSIFYGNEKEAEHDALTFIIRASRRMLEPRTPTSFSGQLRRSVQTSSIHSRNFLNSGNMKKIEIITDEHRHHVYVGNTDFWLDTKELLELYFKLGRVKL